MTEQLTRSVKTKLTHDYNTVNSNQLKIHFKKQ